MDLKQLSKPFPASDIEWRIGRSGTRSDGTVWAMALAYITSRQVHERLDEVVGPENWRMEYREHKGSTICRISIRINGEWVYKEGGSDESNFEAFKGELSGAEKRAGVPWGIGRYLYKLEETFVETSLQKKSGWNYQAKSKNTPAFYWRNPVLPGWALPQGTENSEERIEATVRKEFQAPEPPPTEDEVKQIVKEAVQPRNAEQVKSYIEKRASYYLKHNAVWADPDGKRQGGMVGTLNDLFGGDANRHAALKFLTTKAHIGDISDAGKLALREWINITKDPETQEWIPGQHVPQEAQNVLAFVQKLQGQEKLL